MPRATLQLGASILSLTLAACGGAATGARTTPTSAAPAPGGIALEVENDLAQPVCYLKMSPSSKRSWGNDWLGATEVKSPGSVQPFTIPAAVIRDDRIEINQTIQFGAGSAVIRDESTPIPTQLADVMRAHTELRHVRVEGHTDAHGNAAQNQTLSTARANAVVAWLRAHQVTTQLDAQGFGSSRTLCTDDVDDCNQRNRRVEFFILQ